MIETSATYFPALKARMAAAGVSQTALAAALGHRSPALVCRWLGGTVKATAETLQRVEGAFTGLLAERAVSEATPPEIGAPEGITEATESPDGMFGAEIRWDRIGRFSRPVVLSFRPVGDGDPNHYIYEGCREIGSTEEEE